MDPQTVLNMVIGAGMAALGWFARTQYDEVKAMKQDLAAHKVEVARDYATNADLLRMEAKIDKLVDRLT